MSFNSYGKGESVDEAAIQGCAAMDCALDQLVRVREILQTRDELIKVILIDFIGSLPISIGVCLPVLT